MLQPREKSDQQVLEELGYQLAKRRVARDMTQAALAEKARVGKRTIERLERGESSQTLNLMRVLRALGLLERFETLMPLGTVSPMAILRASGKERKRVRASRETKKDTGRIDESGKDAGRKAEGGSAKKRWKWGDES